MRSCFFTAIFAATLLLTLPGTTLHAAKPKPAKHSSKENMEDAARLQVFLDRAEFAPGKIDGRYGEFTLLALKLYREAHGTSSSDTSPEKPKPKKKSATPDVTGLDLASINPVFIDHTVTEADVKALGEVPDEVAAQARQKSLPYKDAAEAIAEKFHCDRKFLDELNPGKTEAIKAGDHLQVPNVEPFELASVKTIKPGDEIGTEAANDIDSSKDDEKGRDKDSKEQSTIKTEARVDADTNTVRVYEQDKLIAAYPVTIGSQHTESPVGDWKVKGFESMPKFRYDTAMLEKGERSKDFQMLPPGPNSPVGVLWIALNKKGIGLHGTSDPDSIGRSSSHGCIRLANWDVVRLARKIKFGVPVTIH